MLKTNKPKWLSVEFVFIAVITLLFALALISLAIVGVKLLVAESEEPAMKATIKLPDGSATTVNVSTYWPDSRYHTDMITIVDDAGTTWMVDSENVVFTNGSKH